MTPQSFEAVLIRPEGTGTWTYVTVPFSVPDHFGGQGHVPVRGTINGLAFRSTLMPAGNGTHYLVVKKEIRDQIQATTGSTVQVVVEPDPEERTVAVPEDLQAALGRNAQAMERFSGMSYSKQKEYVDWVEASRRPETRERRIESAVNRIAQGLRLKG